MRVRDIKERAEKAHSLLEECAVCPRECGVNRLKGETGSCGIGKDPKVASFNLHTGEEPPISGTRGSGTIFFAGCNLRCRYCQNFPISQMRNGEEITTQKLAGMMLHLQSKGSHNINFVTPSHVVPQILEALSFAWEKGLDLPLVYNTSGYDAMRSLQLLEGIIDVYLPDMRYSDNRIAERLSSVEDYVDVNRKAIVEMYRQVGNLRTDEQGIAERGLIIRHLILPDNQAGSDPTFRFIREEMSDKLPVSLMGQYFPSFRAEECVSIDRKITPEEYESVLESFFDSGLSRGWIQEGFKHEAERAEE
ncbi:MAG: 4Fe-4S cluster-binding domain-containing protein [Candidatus Zixiibacteriota bacterium]|nr:MAG: 4Fe-4S cluster-binding domain-containing protein [candidate division Zixibacteria bacterium]